MLNRSSNLQAGRFPKPNAQHACAVVCALHVLLPCSVVQYVLILCVVAVLDNALVHAFADSNAFMPKSCSNQPSNKPSDFAELAFGFSIEHVCGDTVNSHWRTKSATCDVTSTSTGTGSSGGCCVHHYCWCVHNRLPTETCTSSCKPKIANKESASP